MTSSGSDSCSSLRGSSLKRNIEDFFEEVASKKRAGIMLQGQSAASLLETLRAGLNSTSYAAPDKATLRKAAHSLAELCKQDEFIDEVVAEGAIEVVVPLLNAGGTGMRDQQMDDGLGTIGTSMQEELDKELCFILGLLAVKPEYQTRIAQSGALTGLVRLLKEHKLTTITKPQPGSGGVARRAADAITNLAHENVDIKNMVREQDGIPPLVSLLEAMDVKVQRAACGYVYAGRFGRGFRWGASGLLSWDLLGTSG
jgi:hypothetical protein